MAIKFGDTLENQNTNYPIVDVVGDNIAGIHFVASFTDGNLGDIPVNTRRDGAIVVAQDTHNLYVYKLADTANGANKWNDADGTGWAIQSGDNTLGSDSSFTDGTLQDNTIAVSGLTTSTTITSAIDQLNEVLGQLVPTAPTAWTTFENSLLANTAFTGLQQSTNARLVYRDSGGSVLTHSLNNSGEGQPSNGSTTVRWDTDTSFSNTITIGTAGLASDNNLAQTNLKFILNDESVSMGSATEDGTQTFNTSYAGNITINADFGDFPNTGSSSDGFYQGIDQIAIAATATLVNGYHKFALEDQSGNGVSLVIYRASDSTNAACTAGTLTLTDAGDDIYQSGQKYWTRPTALPATITLTNLIPSDGLVYGASSNTGDNTVLLFSNGSRLDGFAAKSYTNISGITSTNDLRQGQGASFSGSDFTSGTFDANTCGGLLLGNTGSTYLPLITAKSIHGNGTRRMTATNGGGTSARYMFYDQGGLAYNVNQTEVSENKLFNGLHSSASSNPGVRVKDPDVGGTYVDNPSDAQSTYGLWSTQFCNNSSGSLSIDEQDAIVAIKDSSNSNTRSNMRIAHELRNFTTNSSYVFAGNAQNFSGRTAGTAQYITYRFPVNTDGLQFIYLEFQGSLTANGGGWIKIFDTGQTNANGDSISIVDANSSTSGWLSLTDAAVISGGVPTGGATTGGALNKGTTSLQNITLTAGQQRWGNGAELSSVSYVYLRFKLPQNAYIERLALNSSSF